MTPEFKDKLREIAVAAKENSPTWCGANVGEWSRERALINFKFIQAASPDVVLALLEDLACKDREIEIHKSEILRLDIAVARARADAVELRAKVDAVSAAHITTSREVRP